MCSTKAAEAKPCYDKKERKMTFRVQTNSSSDGINEMVLSFDEGSCYTRKVMINCYFSTTGCVLYIQTCVTMFVFVFAEAVTRHELWSVNLAA